MYENVNGYYDGGFRAEVDKEGDVVVSSAHFRELVLSDLPFPLIGQRSVKKMRRIVERAKKRLQKQEDRLLAIKEEFKW